MIVQLKMIRETTDESQNLKSGVVKEEMRVFWEKQGVIWAQGLSDLSCLFILFLQVRTHSSTFTLRFIRE